MPQKLKTYFNWSSGKDASLALYYLQREGNHAIDRLLTSVNSHHDRVSMHGLRRELLYRQARSVGLPITTVELPEKPTMEDYSRIMGDAIKKLKAEGYSHCGFGDIFLEDLRVYRENQLKPYGVKCCFPLWKMDTGKTVNQFIKWGFKAIVNCVKSDLLDKSFVGREIDEQFIKSLPPNVDPCGENGEFHTFCYDGPIFSTPVKFCIGEKVYREYPAPKQGLKQHGKETIGFWFCDLIP